jgi:hypothetical protein
LDEVVLSLKVYLKLSRSIHVRELNSLRSGYVDVTAATVLKDSDFTFFFGLRSSYGLKDIPWLPASTKREWRH